ncbi:alcohol dehydrogenase-like [Solenopsis invicta]|uniref:alcohol dehydrogenase-like n=1 Tax=Solenopsis invicta TaxID=13686 RepID=UPI000E33FED8|nr:alcohol dehydrogenase-like [Solenopsis invicta]
MGKHKGGKGGVIVNISSVTGLYSSCELPMYFASKHAVLGFSQSLARMYDITKMQVVVMCPGPTITNVVGINIRSRMFDSISATVDNSVYASLAKWLSVVQTVEHVALSVLGFIQKGDTGTALDQGKSSAAIRRKFSSLFQTTSECIKLIFDDLSYSLF